MLKTVVGITGAVVAADLLGACQTPTNKGETKMEQSNQTSQNAQTYPFQLPPLGYDYAALEPAIDAETMRLHHDKHHQAYIDKLNDALKDAPDLQKMTIEDLLRNIDKVPENIRAMVRNQGGGHANHQLFWKIMRPVSGGATEPTGALLQAINQDFGSFDALKTKFNDSGAKHFGSGWVFLIQEPSNGKLDIITRPNQDSVLLEHKPALLGNDVWEHAYYLKYQNKRPDYLAAWWQTVNWQYVGERFDGIKAGKAQL